MRISLTDRQADFLLWLLERAYICESDEEEQASTAIVKKIKAATQRDQIQKDDER